jgi:hypothetical protein
MPWTPRLSRALPTSLAEQPAREPEGNVGEDDAQGQAYELEHHELAHAPVDIPEAPVRRHPLEVIR